MSERLQNPNTKTLETEAKSILSIDIHYPKMGHIGSSKDVKYSNNIDKEMDLNMMDIDDEYFEGLEDDDDDDIDFPPNSALEGLGEETLRNFCKKASMLFFDEYGLISHQINSFNQFISIGLQTVFDSFGDLVVTPGFDPSKKGDSDHYRYASVKFGNVTLDHPKFWGGEGNAQEFKMLPRHARIQRMTYSSKMKVNVQVQVWFIMLLFQCLLG